MAEFRRPKLSINNDEDLMQMQQDFISGKIQKSNVKIIPTPKHADDGKKSVFRMRENLEHEKKKDVIVEFSTVQVLRDVIEKVHLPSAAQTSSNMPHTAPQPPVKKSLFAQQMHKKAKMDEEAAKNQQPATVPDKQQSLNLCHPIASAVLGETEAMKIHQENLQKLSSHSEKEILEEQQKLLNSLDPKLLAFLKSKKPAPVNNKMEYTDSKEVVNERVSNVPEIAEELKNPNWLHMDVVEEEKIGWMTPSMPPFKEMAGKAYEARFDFEGRLLPIAADLPVTTALYSHPEEPERPGYTLNELLVLSRSQNFQQRTIALNTIGKLLELARLGLFDRCFEEPLISTLLEHRWALRLRFTLDDSTPSVVSAALVAFSRLLASSLDETCMDRCLLWFGGEVQPDLASRRTIDSSDKEFEAEITDNEMMDIDIIRACLQMRIPQRIRYILEVLRPEARAVLAAFDILTRMARHSGETAQEIMDCPRLMDTIFTYFLPKDWTSVSKKEIDDNDSCMIDNLYGLPVRQAMRLMRVLASWSPQLAEQLTNQYGIFDSIRIYVAIDSMQLNFVKLPTTEGLLLVIDSFHTWRVLLHQGFGLNDFVALFSIWCPILNYYVETISMEGGTEPSSCNTRYSQQLGSSMILMMEAFLKACCHLNIVPHIREVCGLYQVLKMCASKWSWQIQQSSGPIPESAGLLLASTIHFLITFYHHWTDPLAPAHLNELSEKYILPLLRSSGVNQLATTLLLHSNVTSSLQLYARYPESLPSVSPTVYGSDLVPILSVPTPFPLLAAILKLLRAWRAKSERAQSLELDLSNIYFDYLEKVGSSTSNLSGNWFSRFELQFLHELLMVIVEWKAATTVAKKRIVHQAALTTICWIGTDGTAIAKEWMDRIIFNADFLQLDPSELLVTALERLRITQPTHQSLLDKATHQLDKVAKFYIQHLFPLRRSKQSLTVKEENILPADWLYLPLVRLYQQDLEESEGTVQCEPEDVLPLLQAAYLLLSFRPTWFFNIRPVEHYTRLACIFLTGNNLFMDEQIVEYLQPIVRSLSSGDQHLDFSKPVKGVDDFLTFYESLINQYEAVSYGNALFGAFIMLPLQQRQPICFRTKFWCDHSEAARFLTFNEQQMLADVTTWLEPVEEDNILLGKYREMLCQLTSQRNQALYKILKHHLKM